MTVAVAPITSKAIRPRPKRGRPQKAAKDPEIREVRPQPGAQELFLKCTADIAVFGGCAFAGKSVSLLLDALYDAGNKLFTATLFRRSYPQIMAAGGLWDTAMEFYGPLGAVPRMSMHEWGLPRGGRVRFAHLDNDADLLNWQGAQIDYIGFDQLEQFTERQFFYLMSRNRSMSGARARIRGTCNPDPDCFLRHFMSWWIDDDTGLAIEERSGVVRYFARDGNDTVWGATPEEVVAKVGPDTEPKSFTFIVGKITENKIGLAANPGYIATLKNLPLIDRRRLLEGDWNARETAGMFFKREWFEIVDAAPQGVDEIRYWDRAGTETKPGQEHKASWTAGDRMRKTAQNVFYITDVSRFQGSPMTVRETIKNVATQDGQGVRIGLEQDPGQAGKAEVQDHVRNLAGYNVVVNAVRESKGVRAKPLSAQAEQGNVKLVRGAWNEAFIRELENFDGSASCVSDQTDAASGAFHMLATVKRAGAWGRR